VDLVRCFLRLPGGLLSKAGPARLLKRLSRVHDVCIVRCCTCYASTFEPGCFVNCTCGTWHVVSGKQTIKLLRLHRSRRFHSPRKRSKVAAAVLRYAQHWTDATAAHPLTTQHRCDRYITLHGMQVLVQYVGTQDCTDGTRLVYRV
jgi:hypothetical protein